MSYTYTSQRQLRSAFWRIFSITANRRRLPSGDYHVDTRCLFCDWIDSLHRDGQISDRLAARVTLG